MRHLRHSSLMLLVAMLLTSCVPLSTPPQTVLPVATQPQWDCPEVIDARLATFPFGGIGDAVTTWIQDQYGVTVTEIKGGLSANGTGYYQYWWVGQQRYDVTWRIDAKESAVVRVRWESHAPTLADTLRCLGDPPLYRSHYALNPEAIWTYLDLWYPERGIMVTAFVTHKTSGMTTDQVVAYVSYVRPGQPEDLIPRFFLGVVPGEDRYVEILQGLKPWPGDITKITIDERG